MLVRFLSYAASVIGTRRYRPALLSCVALILVGTGAFMVFSAVSSSSKDAASQIQQAKDQAAAASQSTSPQLGVQKQATKDENASVQPADSGNSNAGAADKPAASPAPSSNTAPAFDITLSTGAITLSQSSQSASVQVATSDRSNVVWSVAQDATANSPRLEVETGKENGSSSVIRILGENAANGTYTFTISAKDTKGSLITKNLTVTVNS